MFYANNANGFLKKISILWPQKETHYYCITFTFVLLLIKICSILQNYLNNSD